MSFHDRGQDKSKVLGDFRGVKEANLGTLSGLGRMSPSSQREQERKIRREIANQNERRRMQSINTGFQSLKTLIPHNDGEKLSKAAILQQTSEYIFNLEQEKTKLLQQNTQLHNKIVKLEKENEVAVLAAATPPIPTPPKKRRKPEDSISSDEGIGSPGIDEATLEELRKEMLELRFQLDRERRLRLMYEEQNRCLEAQLYPEKLREIAKQVQIQEQQKFLERQRQQLVATSAIALQPVPTASILHPALPPVASTLPPVASTLPSIPEPKVTMAASTPAMDMAPVTPATMTSAVTNAMARQSLDTIVQAIRHLEGGKTPTPRSTPIHMKEGEDEDEDKENESESGNVSEDSDDLDQEISHLTREGSGPAAETERKPVKVELIHPPQVAEFARPTGIYVS